MESRKAARSKAVASPPPDQGCALRKIEKSPGQWPEPVKSGVPSIWFPRKNLKDFLDTLEPKLGARDYRALLEHILDKMHKYHYNL